MQQEMLENQQETRQELEDLETVLQEQELGQVQEEKQILVG